MGRRLSREVVVAEAVRQIAELRKRSEKGNTMYNEKMAARVMLSGDFDFESLRFQKKGSDIKDAITNKVSRIISDNESKTLEIKRICDERELDPIEVLNAETELDFNNYETKVSSKMIHVRAQGLINALQQDLNTLRSLKAELSASTYVIESLQRVRDNLQGTVDVQLTYRELVQLGF